MNFHWSTIGHNALKRYFERVIESGSYQSHAYLFVGEEHVGKSTLIRDLARMVVCSDGATRPCGSCTHCHHVERGIHPDVFTVYQEPDSLSISIENVLEVIQKLSSTSLFHTKKLCLIHGAEQLTTSAANTLLKTLEEPSGDTLFLFDSVSESSIPETIRSRCQTFQLYPLSQTRVYDSLVESGIKRDTAREMSQYAAGRIGILMPFDEIVKQWDAIKANHARDCARLFGAGYEMSSWYEKTETIPWTNLFEYAHDRMLEHYSLGHFRQFPWIPFADGVGTSAAPAAAGLLEQCLEAMRLKAMNVNQKLLLDSIHLAAKDVV